MPKFSLHRLVVTCILKMFLRYVFCCSYTHNVAPKGKFIAFVSAEAETNNLQSELKPGIDLLGQVDELFFDMYDRYEPVNEPSLDNCFVSTVSLAFCNNKVITSLRYFRCLWKLSWQSYDATTHFETTVTDVLSMYTVITGKVRFMSCLFLLIFCGQQSRCMYQILISSMLYWAESSKSTSEFC